VQPTTSRTPPTITTDGKGVVSHAGTVLLAELADRVGLTAASTEATDSLRERRAGHDPGRVMVDVAVAIADGALTISDVQALEAALVTLCPGSFHQAPAVDAQAPSLGLVDGAERHEQDSGSGRAGSIA